MFSGAALLNKQEAAIGCSALAKEKSGVHWLLLGKANSSPNQFPDLIFCKEPMDCKTTNTKPTNEESAIHELTNEELTSEESRARNPERGICERGIHNP